MKYEIQLWANAFVKLIPGYIGCRIRNLLLPYRRGVNVKVWENVQIDSPSRLILGDQVSINRNCVIHAGGGIVIGDNTLIGPNVIIYSQNHRYKNSSELVRNQGYDLKKVVIGSNVWVSASVIILPGIEIGNNVVIGAGTIVTKNVPDDTIAIGSPLRIIQKTNF
ncbi:acyltransferase [Galbibacter pacificus]|uniref:Acyltransferase n=1 Tax=Galbibacter pacificus TaxID=2996052 RepID=A0ABT6FNE5_9FLAO|nr:acyltransferase [Galbibacter pacificus]MDG3581295.1 acyltransferase [Galbibacter pacificus]MDG3584773.1 acyltransferase [Galbibacter pacificus]